MAKYEISTAGRLLPREITKNAVKRITNVRLAKAWRSCIVTAAADVGPAWPAKRSCTFSPHVTHVITRAGAPVYVDYAHTPDAIESAIEALRPHTQGRLIILLGAGGDRDAGKRPDMGAAAVRLADRVIVTDDNPRSEDPARIRAAIMAQAPGATEVAGRREAIRLAISEAEAGDIVLLAGKGHEQGQIVGDRVLPFDDVTVAREEAA